MARNSSRRTVHIPMVQPRAQGAAAQAGEDRLVEVYTQLYGFDPLTKQEEAEARQSDARARDKDWDQVAASLRRVGLYQAGCAAASAVRKIGIRQPLTALYQRISRLAWIEGQRLQAASVHGPSEGRSAELGLALALLMCASGSRERQIIATGALGGQPHGVEIEDVAIEPVGSLPEKLRLVATLARHGGLPGLQKGSEMLFFTPRLYKAGEDWAEVEHLAEVAQLREYGVRVVPVGRLSEAAAALNALRTRHLVHDRVAQAIVACLLLVALLGSAWTLLQQRSVPVRFLAAGGSASAAQPYQACFTPDGGFYPIPLERNGISHNIPIGETLGWRVQVGENHRGGLSAWFAPDNYYVAQVIVSEFSRAKIMVPQLTGSDEVRIPPGGIWEWGWQLNDRVENNVLVLLAQPDRPFDPDQIRASLLSRFPAADGSAGPGASIDVTAAANFVAAQAPGAAKFVIPTVERTDRCNP